jgi:diguanylate cyclase (GGDEF)-like protein
LTGLSNRRGFADALERAVEQAKRHGSGVALMYIDLDGFKAVNDTRGHDAGDQLLKEIAGRIRGCLRSFDIAARLGGDEFAVLAPDLSDSGLRALAQHIGSAISEPVELEAGALRLTASIGLAQFPTNAEGAAGLLKVADDAMYRAKRAGKDRFKPSGEFDAKRDRH